MALMEVSELLSFSAQQLQRMAWEAQEGRGGRKARRKKEDYFLCKMSM